MPGPELVVVVSYAPPVVAVAEGVAADLLVEPSDCLAFPEIAPVSFDSSHLALSALVLRYTVEPATLDEQLLVAFDVESSAVAGFVAWTGCSRKPLPAVAGTFAPAGLG